MPPSSASRVQDGASTCIGMDHGSGDRPDAPAAAELLSQLQNDRLWLLRQLDAGAWPQWRLDLAALERELGQLLAQAEERLGG